ncbi:MAG: cupredoxin domain-containing protein [Thermoleophilia bacterium]
MTTRTIVATTITTAAALAAATPIVGQMHHPGGGAHGAHEVTITDQVYNPAEMVVAPGQKVTFRNTGVNVHNVISDTGAFASPNLNKNQTFELTAPAGAGTYTFHCNLHTFMRGSLVVSTLTLQGPKKVLVGKAATVRGTVPGGVPGTPVYLERLSGTTWTQIAAGAIAAGGTYTIPLGKMTASAELRARIDAGVSPTLPIAVAPKLVAKKKPGVKNTLTITVTPKAGGKAKVESFNTNTFRWKQVKQFRVPASGKATVKVGKAGRYRVTLLATKTRGEANSATITFR